MDTIHSAYGPIKVFIDDTEIIKEILVSKGIWGFHLDSEVELSREYLEHPHDCKPFYDPLLEILRHYSIPFTLVRPILKDPP